jgi:hypothetical protein
MVKLFVCVAVVIGKFMIWEKNVSGHFFPMLTLKASLIAEYPFPKLRKQQYNTYS